jgi:hypothetical protein
MYKVIDVEGKDRGYSYRCSWCHSCGPVKKTEDEAIDEYLAHQGTEECKKEEAWYDYYILGGNF